LSWWGKLIGGTFGFMLGGPLGAMLGAAVGHNFDRGLNSFADFGQGGGDVERIQSAFFTTTFSMMGYLAKSDGVVTPQEITLAESVMQQMRLNAAQRKVAIRLFNDGKADGFPAEQVLQQFKAECQRRRHLLQMFLEILAATAFADGDLHRIERKVLLQTATALGFSVHEFEAILSRHQAGRQMRENRPDSAAALRDAYKLLGVGAQASDAELKKAYRRLMSQHHPDKLVAKGLPQEMMDIAHRKTLEIKAAYDLVRKTRAQA